MRKGVVPFRHLPVVWNLLGGLDGGQEGVRECGVLIV